MDMTFEELKGEIFFIPVGWPELTWVGPDFIGDEICLGFDNGAICRLDSALSRITKPHFASPSREAVNGVAGTRQPSVAVSTRADVTFSQFDLGPDARRADYPGGAHGVVVTRSGWYVAPLGPNGFLLVSPTKDDMQPMRVATVAPGSTYFYRVAALAGPTGQELLVFANRGGGVGVADFAAGRLIGDFRTGTFDGLDVVDVCGLGDESHSAIAVSHKAELLWFQDVSSDAAPLAMKLSGIRGPVYRVLATPHHLFVLSSKAFYVWANLVDALRSGQPPAPSLHSFEIPMDAVDISLFGECLHFVMAQNALARFRITVLEELLANIATTGERARGARMEETESEVTRFLPTWVTHDVAQEMAVVP